MPNYADYVADVQEYERRALNSVGNDKLVYAQLAIAKAQMAVATQLNDMQESFYQIAYKD